MAIYTQIGSRNTGHYPYTFSVMPEYNNRPLSKDNIMFLYPVSTNKTDCDNFSFTTKGLDDGKSDSVFIFSILPK